MHHNQARQFELGLERHWITHDGYFRMATTLIGMTVTDAWRAYKHAIADPAKKTTRIKEFADRLAWDCIHNKLSTSTSNAFLSIDVPRDVTVPSEVSVCSPVTVASFDSIFAEHKFVDNELLETARDGSTRPQRRTCRATGCRKFMAKHCDHYSCRSFKYNVNGSDKYGVFYCAEHMHVHHAAVAKGSI